MQLNVKVGMLSRVQKFCLLSTAYCVSAKGKNLHGILMGLKLLWAFCVVFRGICEEVGSLGFGETAELRLGS